MHEGVSSTGAARDAAMVIPMHACGIGGAMVALGVGTVTVMDIAVVTAGECRSRPNTDGNHDQCGEGCSYHGVSSRCLLGTHDMTSALSAPWLMMAPYR